MLVRTVLSLIVAASCVAAAPYAPDQILIRFDDSHHAEEFAHPGLHHERALVPSLQIHLFKLDHGQDVEQTLQELRGGDGLRWAQADHYTKSRLVPDDPEFNLQWALDQPSDADIDATEAWDLGTGGTWPDGTRVVAAIVDGGCELTHPDLVDNLWVNTGEIAGNGLDDDENGYVDDVHGWDGYNDDASLPSDYHGTHVAGIVGARGNNLNQVAGVNWDTRLMTVAASSTLTSIVAIGYNYVLENKLQWLDTDGLIGANVVVTNSSFGIDFADCSSSSYPIWNDLYDAMGQAGILSAAATMNRNADVDAQGDVPTGCSSDWLITVTNTTSTDVRNSGAAYGETTIDLGAPGTQVRSTYTGGNTANLTGTSMATPHVAGAVAFVHSVMSQDLLAFFRADPGAGALEIKQILMDSVDPLPALEGITVTGGRLNLHQAALLAASWGGGSSGLSIRIRPADHSVMLAWDDLPGASQYFIEKKDLVQSEWQRVDSTAGTSWSEQVAIEEIGFYRVIGEVAGR